MSTAHWLFQSLISKPVVSENKLLYASTTDFDIDKSEAWQLAYDTLKMVDGELRAAAEINSQRKYDGFAVDGVLGTTSPEQLAKYIRVSGWKPVALNLRVSNVPHLAKTLGGKDLYSFGLAPLRELLQNAADSVEARVAIDSDFNVADGKISVVVTDDGRDDVTVDVYDNGVGMSERVLTGPLLDFGFSFWKSAEARREFPTLQSDRLSPRGRFGIGFFSIFMWADEVEVSTRMYSLSADETNVLHFKDGLDARPMLRTAAPSERSMSWSTRIRLRIPRETATRALRGQENSDRDPRFERMHQTRAAFDDWPSAVQLLTATLPIVVDVKVNGVSSKGSYPNWKSASASEFSGFFQKILFPSMDSALHKFAGGLTDLVVDGAVAGRGFIVPDSSDSRWSSRLAIYDRGIYAGMVPTSFLVGVVEGRVVNAAREKFEAPPFEGNSTWLREASERAFAVCAHAGEELAIQRSLIRMNYLGDSRALFIRDRKVVSLRALIEYLRAADRVWLRLEEENSDLFQLKATDSIGSIYGLKVDPDRVYALVELTGQFRREDTLQSYLDRSNSLLASLLKDVVSAFGPDYQCTIDVVERESYQKDYIDLKFSRA